MYSSKSVLAYKLAEGKIVGCSGLQVPITIGITADEQIINFFYLLSEDGWGTRYIKTPPPAWRHGRSDYV